MICSFLYGCYIQLKNYFKKFQLSFWREKTETKHTECQEGDKWKKKKISSKEKEEGGVGKGIYKFKRSKRVELGWYFIRNLKRVCL
jgi:hypothetical protein